LLKKFGKAAPERQVSLQNLCRARLLNEKVTASKSVKEARKLKIAEASSNAERDLAIQMAEEAEEQIEALEKQRVLEIKILKSRISESKDGAEKAPDNEKDQLIEDLCGILESKTSQLVELKTTVKEVKKAHDTEIAELKDKYDLKILEKIGEVENKNQKKLIDSYIDLKLGQTGLTVHRNARALLGKCTSTDEVDSIFNQIKDAMKRDALRPGTIDEIRVHKQDSTQSQKDIQVKESVDNACKGMSY